MELKPKYEHTEVGIFPLDWTIKSFGDLFEFSGGFTASRDQLSENGYCYLHYGDIHGSRKTSIDADADFQDIPKLSIPLNKVSPKSLLKDGDVVFVDASEDNEGTSRHVVVLNKGNQPFISGLHTIVAKSKTADLVNEYRQYCFQTTSIRRQFLFYSVGTKVSGISKSNIPKLIIPIPPLPEQRAIASALSDVDALLEGLNKLIAKKSNFKQAAMQELLTCKTRLPGFHGEWEVKRLGDVAEIVMGQSPSSSNYNLRGVGLPLIQGNADIKDRKTIKRVFTSLITKRGRKGDILMSVRAPVGEISRAIFEVCLGRGVCAIRFPNDFLYHYLVFLEPDWAQHSKGSTFDSVNSADVWAVEIKIPLDSNEQTAIATALSDMDAEIDALEQRREKTKDIKQAMMQELLTGKTRLV
jgi:type I restriction enzyme S subunit